MTDFEKEKAYKEAVGFLNSSLTNSENKTECLKVLESLGDYKDAKALLEKYTELLQKENEQNAYLNKRRRVVRGLQALLTVLGFAVVCILILILVYALRNPPWR